MLPPRGERHLRAERQCGTRATIPRFLISDIQQSCIESNEYCVSGSQIELARLTQGKGQSLVVPGKKHIGLSLLAIAATLFMTIAVSGSVVVEAQQNTTTITVGETTTIDGAGATLIGNVATITSGGSFTVSGVTTDGMIEINAPGQTVDLILSGADITNPVGPAILITTAAEANITLADGTENRLTDGGTSEFDAALYGAVSFTIDGEGSLEVHAVDEGISSTEHITMNSGTVRVFAYEDGLNANQDGVSVITINGGYLYVQTEIGDGIDSNGAITITGGTVNSLGALADMNGGIDADGAVTFDGGTIIATGMNISTPQADSAQRSVLVSFGQTLPAGTLIVLQDADADLLNFAPAIDFQTLLFSSPALADGVEYTVSTGGTPTGEAIDGLYSEPASDPGMPFGTVNTESANQQFGPGGGRPPGA